MTGPLAAMHDLRVAAGFLTRVPVGDVTHGGAVDVKMERAVPWFPIVGAVVGVATGLLYVGLSEVVTSFVAAALSVCVGLLITGAFHYDGLADMADAFGGGWTVERRMEILKDSRLGTYGTAALCMALVVEVAALQALTGMWALRSVAAAHMLSRALSVAAMVLGPQAGDGMGASFMQRLGPIAPVLALLVSCAAAIALLGVHGLVAIVAGAAITLAVTILAVRKIGGLTGDVLGAVQVLSALGVLVIAGA